MNRWDEIKGAALDVAQHVTQDPAKRDAMANDLITLIGLMVNAVGKGVAIDGEADMNDARDSELPWEDGSFDPTPELVAEAEAERAADAANAYTRYLTGEGIQRRADHVAEESRTADLQRWASHGPTAGWHPRCPECGERDGHVDDCNARCRACNRVLRFGHCHGCIYNDLNGPVAGDVCCDTPYGPDCKTAPQV